MIGDKTTRIEDNLKVDGELKLMDSSSPTGAMHAEAWLEEHGMELLNQLNALEMNQDRNHWASSGLYAAANTVMVVAVISALDLRIIENSPPLKAFGVFLLGLIGAFLATTWFLIAMRSRTYETLWIEKSYWVERQCNVPKQCHIWEKSPPEGVSGWQAIKVFIGIFYWIWVVTIAAALCSLIYWTLPETTSRVLVLAGVAFAILFTGFLPFWRYQIRAEKKLEIIKKELLKRLWPPDGKKLDESSQ